MNASRVARNMPRSLPDRQFVVCARNRGYRASLVVRRLHELVPDPQASERGLSRVVDQFGEDYLYPSSFSVATEFPPPVERAIAGAT